MQRAIHNHIYHVDDQSVVFRKTVFTLLGILVAGRISSLHTVPTFRNIAFRWRISVNTGYAIARSISGITALRGKATNRQASLITLSTVYLREELASERVSVGYV